MAVATFSVVIAAENQEDLDSLVNGRLDGILFNAGYSLEFIELVH